MVALALLTLIWLDAFTGLFVTLIVLTSLNGYWLGASRLAAGFAGTILAILLAVPAGHACEGLLHAIFNTSGLVNRLLSIGTGGAIVALVASVALAFPVRWLTKKHPTWRRFDKSLGTGLGGLEGVLLGLMLLWGIFTVQPIAERVMADAAQAQEGAEVSRLVRRVVSVARSARATAIGRMIGDINPLKEMRLFDLFSRIQVVLNDPAARDAIAKHPAIERIRHRPSVERTLAMLSAEPEFANLEDGISDTELHKLATSSRVLAILDETGLLADLPAIASDLQEAIDATAARER